MFIRCCVGKSEDINKNGLGCELASVGCPWVSERMTWALLRKSDAIPSWAQISPKMCRKLLSIQPSSHRNVNKPPCRTAGELQRAPRTAIFPKRRGFLLAPADTRRISRFQSSHDTTSISQRQRNATTLASQVTTLWRVTVAASQRGGNNSKIGPKAKRNDDRAKKALYVCSVWYCKEIWRECFWVHSLHEN